MSTDEMARRHARDIASAYVAARAAGCTAFDDLPDPATIVQVLEAGLSGTGKFSEVHFRYHFPTDQAVAVATLKHLEMREGYMVSTHETRP